MAEFKLGRIRFVWKGAWVASTLYYRDDIIRYGGRTYICVSGHTSATLFTTDESTKWQKFSDGAEWQADWISSTVYKVNDIVKYGGYIYICNTGHTSEGPSGKLETDQAKWDLFAEGFDWKDSWIVNTQYKTNDIVKYGGTLYLCTAPHTSATTFATDVDGLEQDSDKWDIFAQGVDWKTDWVYNTRYKKNDEVKYGGVLYICNEGHISGTIAQGIEADQTKWDYLHKGVEYKSVHAGTTRYKLNDVVKYGGGLWICNRYHTSTTNLASDVTATGSIASVGTISGADVARTAGTYNDVIGSTSGSGDVANTRFNIVIDEAGAATSVIVVHTGSGHVATDVISIPNTQIGGSGATLTFNVATIENTTQWSEFVAGLEFEDSWSSATNYQPGDFVTYGGYSYISKSNNNNVVPFGNAGDWDLFTTGFNLQGDYNNATAYKVGDVIRLGGYTYLAKANTTGNRPPNATYWDRLNQGIEWKDAWTNATLYDAGDAVRGIGNVNSYICILGHTSDQVSAQNRPDQDVAGTYWKLLSGGVESGNLTTVGDLVYYGGSGPVRLPIGTAGQVLKVNAAGDAPEWSYFGQVEGVYYVSPTGSDGVAPIDGVTLDKPWKSVRYALNEIRKGPRNPDAATLLKRNKAFIAEEAGVQYVAWKIANNSAPFSTGYTHDAAKCSRDMGIIIDGFLYDIGHGDNRRTRENALSFFSPEGASYIAGQTSQTVDVINYMVSIIDTTIRNLAPAINYQTTNGVGSPVLQKIDATKDAEDGVYARIQVLAAMITDAITAGSISTIPVEVFAYNTLFVKTGIYKETLPMIVPEGTAVIGDELRSTEINALGSADSVTTLEHTTLTLNGLLHIKSIIDEICVNGAITKTPAGAHLTMDTFSAADGSRTAGTYTGVTGTTSGTGTVGTFDIVVDGSGAVTSVTVVTAGHGHIVNNTITITDANLGSGGAANFTMAVATIAAGNTKTQDVALPAGSAAAGTQAQTLLQDVHDKINIEVFGIGDEPKLTGKSGRDSTQGYVDARLRILENLDFIAEEVVEYLKTAHTKTYDFTKDAKCKSDMKEYLYAIMYDLEQFGNYKSWLYGRWASNAVKGSKHEDMYYCQNATGVRNQTLKGLKGQWHRASVTTNVAHGYENGDLIELRDMLVSCSLGNKIYPIAPPVNDVSAATYDAATGLMELTVGTHNYRVNQYVSIATDSLTFSCTFDNNATNHTYPRATGSSHPGGADPAYNTPVKITAITATTITMNVGTGSADTHSVSAATYDPATGVMELTIGSHTLVAGNYVDLATDSLTFTCALDSHATNHTYPRATGSSASYSVSAATYTPATGVMELTIGSHQYETGKFVNIATNSLTFTCALDSHATNHTYPRATGSSAPGGADYAYDTPVEITGVTATTITMNVGISSDTSAHTFVSATADCITNPGGADYVHNTPIAITGATATTITMNVGISSDTSAHTFVSATADCVANSMAHTFVSATAGAITGDTTKFEVLATGLTATEFQVAPGTSATAQTYVSGGSVVKDGGARLAITDFVYDVGTGIATITTATNGLSAGDTVDLYGIITNCEYGQKVYPPLPFSGTYPVTKKVSDTELNFYLPDSEVTDHAWVSGGTVKTVTVTNVGSPTDITGFTYGNTSGYTTVVSIDHGLARGDAVRVQSVKVSCSQGEKVYPDAHSSSSIFIVYDVVDANTFTYGMDKSTFIHTYIDGGTVQKITYTATQSKSVGAFKYSPKGLLNAYGTKRFNSGAFISLDPGFGPNDREAFIHLKSPYIQNVTNIGEKCIGLKIDGDLHAGGLDSFVANDFTQIVDEGISIWCTNLGRVELVSVFTYYGHIGYLAENGGKIRATNGNNSYGNFGSVSEGIDLTEEYVNAYVNNRSYQAIIGNIIVDNNKIIAVEYTNAGRDYIPGNTTYEWSGDGYGITGTTAVVVTAGVMQVRMTGDASTFGGADYITAGNTIQNGNATQVTLSNTDIAISSAYVGMAIVLTSGKGAGQIAYVDTYNAGTKLATVKKPSDDTAGWDHMISGTAIETLLDNTTTYQIEPRVTFSAPAGDGSTATATAQGRAKVVDGKIIEVRIYNPGASYVSEPTVTFTDPNNTADAPHEVYLGDGVLTQPTFTDAGTGWTTVSATVLDSGETKNITGVTYTANPFAEILLVANKEYVKDEVTAWIDAEIAGAGSGTLWDGFVHDKVKCERDIGYLIDAFVHDLKYGSNRETVKSAKKYWIGANFVGGEALQIVAAYEQMRTILLDFILDNAAYGSLQSVTTQTTNSDNGEAVAQTRLGELITIVTHVVLHGLSVVPTDGGDGILDITVTGHNITPNTKIAIDGVVGTNQLNANTYYVSIVDVDTLRLYIDEQLLHPAVGSNYSAYISDGTITYNGGYRDEKQSGKYIQVESMLAIPQPGSNIEFASVPNTWFKLVSVTNLTGSNPYSALLQLSPNVEIPDSPAHGEVITIRIRYSQVRLTGHDFLDVGTGNFITTNYPGIPTIPSDQLDETIESGGGRVFMTSTDQDGNFRVGDLFTVEQATGIATLNADAFSISGLQELQLGSVAVGSAGATINEFSTDGTFTANSDQIVPTQKAIKTFITSQIGGGASELNVNSVTAGIINIQGNTITTTTGARINTTATMHFSAGVSGAPVAMQQFLLS